MVEIRKDFKSNTWIVTTTDSEGFHRQLNLSDEDYNWLAVDWIGRRFEEASKTGLGEYLLFGEDVGRFIEGDARQSRVLNAVVKICNYDTPARVFARMVSYDEFRNKRGIGEVSALGLRMLLLYKFGVDWLKPDTVGNVL